MDESGKFHNKGPVNIVGGNVNNIHNVLAYNSYSYAFPEVDRTKLIRFRLLNPDEYFTGRLEELQMLDNQLQRKHTTENELMSTITVVSGLGGIGKSQLVRKYVQSKAKNDTDLIWINAENENDITESFTTLAKDKLGIATVDANRQEKSVDSLIEEIYEFFRDRNSLFIYDNVVDKVHMKRFLLPRSPGLSIIITSRIREWDKTVAVVNLQAWKSVEAIEFVQKFLSDPFDGRDKEHHKAIKSLVERLQYFPLALRQATAYIDYQQDVSEFSIEAYLILYDKKAKELLDSNEFQNSLYKRYDKTTYTTWIITVTTINENKECGKLALKILHVIAYFAPNDIHRSSLKDLLYDENELPAEAISDGDGDELLISAVRLLVKYSMIDSQNKQEILSVHRLVQKVTKINLRHHQLEKDILCSGLNLFTKLMKRIKHGSHAVSVFQHALKYEELLERFGCLSNIILINLFSDERSRQALSFGKIILKPLIACYGEDHRIVASVKDNIKLGEALAENDGLNINYVKCEMYHEIYEMRRHEFGEDDPDTIAVKLIIGRIRLKSGYYKEAFEIFHDIRDCNIRTKELIADTYIAMHLFEEGLEIYQQILQVFEKLELKPEFLVYYKITIAVTLLKMDRNKEALHILESIPDSSQSHYKGSVKRGLAQAYFALKRYDEASSIFEDEYNKTVETYGPHHLIALEIRSYIVSILFYKNMYSKAMSMHQENIETLIQLLGENHPKVLITNSRYAKHLQKQGRTSEALQMLTISFETAVNTFGKHNSTTLLIQDTIATVHSREKDFVHALSMYEQILSGTIGLGVSHRRTLLIKAKIAITLTIAMKFEEAKIVFDEICSNATDKFKRSEEYLVNIKMAMAMSLFYQQNYDEAYLIFNEILNEVMNLFGENQPIIMTLKTYIGDILLKQGNFERAATIHNCIYETYASNAEYDHLEAIAAQYRVAKSLYYKENFDGALTMYRDIWERRVRLFEEDNVKTLKVLDNSILNINEQFNEAYSMFDGIYEEYLIEHKGKDAENTLTIREKMAVSLHNQGEVLPLQEELLETKIKMLDEDHLLSTLNMKLDIANTLSKLQYFKEATDIFVEIHKILTSKFKLDQPMILAIRKSWAQSLCDQKKYEEAIKIYSEALETINGEFGENHPDTLDLKLLMAQSLSYQGNSNEAIQILKDVYQIFAPQNMSGKEILKVLRVGHFLFELYRDQLNFIEALPLLESMEQISVHTFGEDDKHTLKIKFDIGCVYATTGVNERALEYFEDVYEKHVAQFGNDENSLGVQATIAMTKDKCEKVVSPVVIRRRYRLKNESVFSDNRKRVKNQSEEDEAVDSGGVRKAIFSLFFAFMILMYYSGSHFYV